MHETLDHKQRVDALEIKVAFQEEVIHQLDHALGDQQRQLLDMAAQIKILNERIKEVQVDQEFGSEPPPPHY